MSYLDNPEYETSSYYYTQDEAYPMLLGGIDAPCIGNQHCQDGLSCQTESGSGWQSCRLPPKVEEKCTRSPFDQRCHFLTNKGNKVLCSDKQCSPESMDPPQHVDPHKCSRAKVYFHQPSGSSFCGSINQNTGQFEQMPEKCCHTSMGHIWDLEPDYVKYSLSPQYYGVQ